MKNGWVVANAAQARVLEQSDKAAVFVHVADLVHPQGRQKGSEPHGDRPGRAPGTVRPGAASPAYNARTLPREREHEHFAHELATLLEQRTATECCVGLALVASDPLLGRLKKHLSEQAYNAVRRTVAADDTHLGERERARRFAALAWTA